MNDWDRTITGQSFLNLITFIKKQWGQDGVDKIFGILKKEHPRYYINPKEINAKEAYPELIQFKILEVMDHEFGNGDTKLCTRFGRYNANNLGFKGFFISFLGSPTKVLTSAPSSWARWHNNGELVVTKAEPGIGVFEIRDYLANEYMCAELLGFFNTAANLTRAKNVVVKETKCKCQGADVCEFTVTWDA